MIVVKVDRNEIEISGHAKYAEIGRDIVCAGVSTLVQTLILSIENLTKDKIEYDIQEGYGKIRYKNLSEQSKTLIDSFFIGICMIAEEYPDNVRVV